MRGLLLLSTIIAAPALAQVSVEIPPPSVSAQGDVAVTIYNNDLALVQDVRPLNFRQGRSRQKFPDVSAHIRPETVTLTVAGATIVEQNFDYDLLSPASLMQKAVGETITLVRTNPATGAETRERAWCWRPMAASSSRSAIGSRCCATTACRSAPSSTRCPNSCAPGRPCR